MATPHLRHLLPWDDLKELLRQRDPSAVHLPVGKQCGKIHARDKQSQSLLSRRSGYIPDHLVCHDLDCVEILDLPKAFGKDKKPRPVNLSVPSHRRVLKTGEEERRLRHFAEQMSSTIKTFAKQEREKLDAVLSRSNKHTKQHKALQLKATEEYVDQCVRTFRGATQELHYTGYDREYALMTNGGDDDLAILLYLDQQGKLDAEGAMAELYGSQAVGNGIRFLLNSLFYFYFGVNAIAAAEYLLEKPDQWGLFEEGSCYRYFLDHDCDFYTFVPGWRTQLGGFLGTESKLIKDWPNTMDVLRKTFRFFVVCEVLFQRYSRYVDTFSPPKLAIEIGWATGLDPEEIITWDHHCKPSWARP